MARRRRNRSSFLGEPNGLHPGDDIGNRINQKAQAYIPDDLGNRKEDDKSMELISDDIGNRIDQLPTHELSGVLSFIDDARKNRRRKSKNVPSVRVGRYVAGGVNPLVATDQPRAQKAQEDARQASRNQQEASGSDHEDGRSKKRKRRKRGPVDAGHGTGTQDLNERRAQRFFDFEEDDRFDYLLKSAPVEKCAAALSTVENVLRLTNRNAICTGSILEDGERPKVLIVIDDQGPSNAIPADRLSVHANKPLFSLGHAALMSLNYLVNKIVNRYPNDRIRLAILPKSEEKAYLAALAEHQKHRYEARKSDSTNDGQKENGQKENDTGKGEGPLPEGQLESKENRTSKMQVTQKKATEEESAQRVSDDAPVDEERENTDEPKETTAKKTTAKKTTAKKTTAKKTTAKKTTAKKTTAKKTTAKKTTAKKTTAKKTTAKKTTAKKSAS